MTAYTIKYQLGAVGSKHRSPNAAADALRRAINAARRGGDDQAIWVEDSDGNRYSNDIGRYPGWTATPARLLKLTP